MKIKGYAKINLSLNILGVSGGFHQLESVVAQISLCDKITIRKSKSISVEYSNGFSINPERDNAYRACKLFQERFNTGGATIKIKKSIPLKAGLGGSSADSVGVILGMQKLYNITDQKVVQEVLILAGSDCPVQYAGGYNLMKGRGEVVEKIHSQKRLYGVILTEPNGVNTAECFAWCDRQAWEQSDNQQLIDYLTGGGKIPKLKNAMYLPATKLNPKVEQNLKVLTEFFDAVNMSGSGSAVYGISPSKKVAKKAYKKLKAQGRQVYLVTVG